MCYICIIYISYIHIYIYIYISQKNETRKYEMIDTNYCKKKMMLIHPVLFLTLIFCIILVSLVS